MPKTNQNLSQSNIIRNNLGQFVKRCGSIIHYKNDSDLNCKSLIDIKRGKTVSAKDVQRLKYKGIITKSISFICKSCLERCKESGKIQEDVEAKNSSESCSGDIDHSCNVDMQLGSATEITSNAKTLFLNQSENLKLDNLIDFDTRKWLQQKPVSLVISVADLCNITLILLQIKS